MTKGLPVARVCFILSWVFWVSINLIKASSSNLNKSSSDKVVSIVVSPPLKTWASSFAKELAHVLSGGDTTIDTTLSEDDLFKLELDAFMRLIETQKTQDRIKHTLATGKPLVN